MATLNLNKKLFLVILVSFFLFSCIDDKEKNCTYMNLRPYIILRGFQPTDAEVKKAYLLVYSKNDFKNKIDSINSIRIISDYKKRDDISSPNVHIYFDDLESKKTNLDTEHNYILVTDNKTKYMISGYTFKQVSRKMLFKIKKYCLVDSMKVSNIKIEVDGATLWFSKNLGVPLK
ncbi:hypothetical protein [Tenacibaculum ovolyticum]|uniref:hypothetical protein n=1 Tax=Tenacibaculum ovolyticum TaxID=104270 RepID=UPI0007ED6D54|nr:hypothetical protein [Tenacibaculum ovolyticum]